MRFVLALVLIAACSKTSEPVPATPPTVAAPAAKDPAKARELIAKGATVIDVRTSEEFAGGHVPNATNIPVQMFDKKLADVDALVGGDKTKPVVVYCAKGSRAAKAKTQLEAAGYTNVVNGGGLDDLQQ